MAKAKKSATKTVTTEKKKNSSNVVSGRKITSASTRVGGRQRSGNNDPQPGSH